jgi:16S rRNA (guanine527-N7)-methyltransferase
MTWKDDLIRDFGLSPEQVGRLVILLDHVSGESDRNLTAVTGSANIVDFHFRDSLSILDPLLAQRASRIVDIGSGAGFPGLPLAVALPLAHFTLIDSRRGKSSFISDMARLLELENVTVLCQRAEEAGHSPLRESFDTALARALGSLPVSLELTLPFVRRGGSVLLQRGRRVDGDLNLARSVSAKLGGELSDINHVTPFPSARNLHLWTFLKVSETPAMFPRRTGVPEKRPLD